MAKYHPHEVDDVLSSMREAIRKRIYALEQEPLRDFADTYDPTDIVKWMIEATRNSNPGAALVILVDRLVGNYAEGRYTEEHALAKLDEEYAHA